MYDACFNNEQYKIKPFVQRTGKNTYQGVVTICSAVNRSEESARHIVPGEYENYDEALLDARLFANRLLAGGQRHESDSAGR